MTERDQALARLAAVQRENDRLREALADLLTAYAACNGEDHPAYRRARAALNGEGET